MSVCSRHGWDFPVPPQRPAWAARHLTDTVPRGQLALGFRVLRPSQLTVWLSLSEPQFLHLQYGTITQTWPGAAHMLAPAGGAGEGALCFRRPWLPLWFPSLGGGSPRAWSRCPEVTAGHLTAPSAPP